MKQRDERGFENWRFEGFFTLAYDFHNDLNRICLVLLILVQGHQIWFQLMQWPTFSNHHCVDHKNQNSGHMKLRFNPIFLVIVLYLAHRWI